MGTYAQHEQRVIDEDKELKAKIEKLVAFTGTPTFSALRLAERRLLTEQLSAMHSYGEILKARISLFEPT